MPGTVGPMETTNVTLFTRLADDKTCSCEPWYEGSILAHSVTCALLDESTEAHNYSPTPDENHAHGLSFRFVPSDIDDRFLERWFTTDADRCRFEEVEALFDARRLGRLGWVPAE